MREDMESQPFVSNYSRIRISKPNGHSASALSPISLSYKSTTNSSHSKPYLLPKPTINLVAAMAKKKHSAATATTTATAAAAAAEPRKEGAAPPSPPARDPSPEKVESLKSLNHLLLVETVERREQVSQLLSRIDHLAFDHSFLSAIEQDVVRVVLASYLADLRSLAAARELSADAKARDLESSLASMAADRNAAEKEMRFLRETAKSLSEALKQADEKLNLAAREKVEIENHLDSVLSERDSIRKDLDGKVVALFNLDSIVCEWLILISVMEEILEQVRIKNGELLEHLNWKEEALQVLIREKNAIEVKLEEQQRLAVTVEKDMEERVKEKQVEVESLVAEKKVFEVMISALEERHCCVVEKNQQLQCEVHSLNEAVNLLKKEEADVRSKLTMIGKSYSILDEEHERLLIEFSSLEKEKEKENEELQIEALREFENLRQMMLKEIQDEKVLVEGVRSEKEAEISNLKNELEKLQSDVLDLQDKCRDYSETNNNLRADKDSIQKALRLEKLVTSKLKSQVEELKKIKDGKEQELLDAEANSQAKAEKIEGLSQELGLLQLALVEAKENKGSAWTWLCPIITTVFAAVSFAYATRRC